MKWERGKRDEGPRLRSSEMKRVVTSDASSCLNMDENCRKLVYSLFRPAKFHIPKKNFIKFQNFNLRNFLIIVIIQHVSLENFNFWYSTAISQLWASFQRNKIWALIKNIACRGETKFQSKSSSHYMILIKLIEGM